MLWASCPAEMLPVRIPVDLILAAAGLYCLVVALLLWWLGIRPFLRKFWERPSRRIWGPAIVEDYLLARAVTRRLRWAPLRLRVLEFLFLLGFLLLVAAMLVHHSEPATASSDQGRNPGGWPIEERASAPMRSHPVGRSEGELPVFRGVAWSLSKRSPVGGPGLQRQANTRGCCRPGPPTRRPGWPPPWNRTPFFGLVPLFSWIGIMRPLASPHDE